MIRALRWTIGTAILLALFVAPVGAAVWYVDDDVVGGDGSSWANAFQNLQDALTASVPGDEIRVAEGNYLPDALAPGDRLATFSLKTGVTVSGGWNPALAVRDPDVYLSILTGDLLGNDGPGFLGMAENSKHVVTADSTGPGTVLDGFRIRRGNADGPLYPDAQGACLLVFDAQIDVIDCQFARGSAASGSGVALLETSTANFLDCEFNFNRADVAGAGMFCNTQTTCIITGGLFRKNTAVLENGGGLYVAAMSATVENVLFDENTAAQKGGGVLWAASAGSLVHCRLRENVADLGGGVATLTPGVIARCRFRENTATFGGGLWIDRPGFDVLSTIFYANAAGAVGGAVYAVAPPAAETNFVNCSVLANTAGMTQGGVRSFQDLFVANSIFWGNSDGTGMTEAAQLAGGGLGVLFTVDFSCVMNLSGAFGGVGNIGDDPLFVDESTGDVHILPCSPCRDAGDSMHSLLTAFDHDGQARISGVDVDMGADEAMRPYVGTNEDLCLETRVNGVATLDGVAPVTGGDLFEIHFRSPGGTFDLCPAGLVLDLFATGAPPSFPGAPELYFAEVPDFSVFYSALLGGPVIAPAGVDYAFVIPGFVGAGNSIMVQAMAITVADPACPPAANGFYAATDGNEMIF